MKIDENRMKLIRSVHIGKLMGTANIGRRISIRCPIGGHRDRTPSMVIYPDGSYHCFGCTAHGKNAIDFLMAMGATFSEAVEELDKYI